MSRPISKNLLTCSATLHLKQSYDEDRNIVEGATIQLSNIWITTTRGITNGSNGLEASDTMLLFYDSVNSKASNSFTWEMGCRVTFMEHDYYVSSITPCMSNGLHHYEIGLK